MPLSSGTKLGQYEIAEAIGAGGMGEVYRARNTKLGREVAIKVLPEAFAQNEERLARFEREARLLASLNHPNIATLYGFEQSDGVRFLVMELADGETLAERLRRGPIPVEDALPIFKQIAEGLEAAHEKGIIHRDLKPANIKVSSEGKVKVLDFGLAKAMSGDPVKSEVSESPTITRDATATGVILGTAAYMSPEQARGKPIDKRTDIWAFGCCLYEAITGRVAFLGETVSDTLAKVLERQADWGALPEATPGLVRSLLRRCLRKDLSGRLRDMADVRIEIEEALAEPHQVELAVMAPVAPLASRRMMLRGLAILIAGILAGGLVVWTFIGPETTGPHIPKRLNISVPPSLQWPGVGSALAVLALSPDGTRVVFSAYSNGERQLYMRPIDQLEITAIPGTEGGYSPFFSPDSKWLGFASEGKLKKVAVDGGEPLPICDADAVRGASWGADGSILFAAGDKGLLRVSAQGGTPQVVTRPETEAKERLYRWPQILPGGQAALFSTMTTSQRDEERTVSVLSLKTAEWRVLVKGATYPRYVPTGHLLYARVGSIVAAPFDLKRLELIGPPEPVLDDVRMTASSGSGYAYYDISAEGSLIYVPGYPRPTDRTLVWVDRSGNVEPLTETRRPYMQPRLSPDGDRLVVGIEGMSTDDIWLLDIERGMWTRLTFEGNNGLPTWSPDGEWVVFDSNRHGAWNLFRTPADGSGATEQLTESEYGGTPGSFSPDGTVIFFVEQKGASGWDIWMQPLEGDTTLQPFLVTPFAEVTPTFSPNGRWVAYRSLESGRNEIYVRPYLGPGRKWQISTDDGVEPVWSKDGRELFYRNGDNIMVVPVQTEPDFAAGRPQLLFVAPFMDKSWRSYDVTPDGQRFVMVQKHEDTAKRQELVVVPDWFEELKRLVPTN